MYLPLTVLAIISALPTTISAAHQDQPTKEKLIVTLRQLVENLEKSDYSAASKLVVLPGEMNAQQLEEAFSTMIARREISRSGIARLDADAKFGTAIEVFGKERANYFADRSKVPLDSLFGFNFEGAEALATWQNGRFKMIRFDDIGKLAADAKPAQTTDPTSIGAPLDSLIAAVKEQPKDPKLRASLAVALYEQQRLPEAWKHLRVAHQIDPENEEYVGGLATLLNEFEESGLFATGENPNQIAKILGPPDEKVDLGEPKSRWLYSFFGIDVEDSKVFAVIDLRGATEALFYPTETISITLDQRKWNVGFRKKEDSLVSEMWFLPGESATSWTEQISIERILDISNEGTTEELANFMIEQMKAGTDGLKAKLLIKDDTSATVSFEIPLDDKGNAIHRLVRIIKGPKDLHRIGISLVKKPDQATQQKWFQILQAAKLDPVDSGQ